MHYVYIIQSIKDKTYYTGVTMDIKRRITEHNEGKNKYSSIKRPFVLIWSCSFQDKINAYKFEKYLKSGSGIAFRNKHLL